MLIRIVSLLLIVATASQAVPVAAERRWPRRAIGRWPQTLADADARLAAPQWVWPVLGLGWIASGFGPRRHPLTGRAGRHRGVDIAASNGVPILAAGGGRVQFAGWLAGYGRLIEIDHGHGWLTRYAHAQVLVVSRGQTVFPGQVIARVGQSGLATGPHLHFEVWHRGDAVNPLSLEWFHGPGSAR